MYTKSGQDREVVSQTTLLSVATHLPYLRGYRYLPQILIIYVTCINVKTSIVRSDIFLHLYQKATTTTKYIYLSLCASGNAPIKP